MEESSKNEILLNAITDAVLLLEREGNIPDAVVILKQAKDTVTGDTQDCNN